MGFARKFWRGLTPINPWTFLSTMLVFSSAIQNRIRTNGSPSAASLWFGIALIVVTSFLWAIVATRRLLDLRLSWMWILPIAICYMAALFTAYESRVSATWIALGLAVVAQLPLFFLVPPKDPLQIGPRQPAEPS